MNFNPFCNLSGRIYRPLSVLPVVAGPLASVSIYDGVEVVRLIIPATTPGFQDEESYFLSYIYDPRYNGAPTNSDHFKIIVNYNYWVPVIQISSRCIRTVIDSTYDAIRNVDSIFVEYNHKKFLGLGLTFDLRDEIFNLATTQIG